MSHLLYCLIFILSFSSTYAQEMYPSVIVQMDGLFSHHIFVAEKSTHELHLYENSENGVPKLIKTYQMVSGKKPGDKFFQGDHRTPEGLYYLTEFIPHSKLNEIYDKATAAIYGAGAFVINYPNPMDKRMRKTGGGIWLHSTNDETRIEKGLDSRGCLVTANNDLKELSRYLELEKTPVIIVHDLTYLKKSNWDKTRHDLVNLVDQWADAWRQEDLETYTSFYHPDKFHDSFRGNFQQFKQYKKAVFSNKGKPFVEISNLTIVKNNQYAMAMFIQDYRSDRISDAGRKILYFEQDEFYSWKIVEEHWSKIDKEMLTSPFQPSPRFFTANNQGPF